MNSKKFLPFVLGIFLSFFFSNATQAQTTIDEQVTGLRALCGELKTHYGMLQFKESQLGVGLEATCAEFEHLIRNAKTLEEAERLDPPDSTRKILSVEEYRQLLIGFAARFKDGHFNVLRNSTSVSTIGLRTIPIDGKLTVVGFDPTYYSESLSNPHLQVGDEIVSVDGQPVEALARRNMLYMQSATHQSRWERAMANILNVSNRSLRSKKKGAPVRVRFRRGQQEWTAEFRWSHTNDFTDLKVMARVLDPNHQVTDAAVPYYYGASGRPETYFHKGLEQIFDSHEIIDLGKLINLEIGEGQAAKIPGYDKLSRISRIPVYMIRYKGKSIGVIRIPDYAPEDQIAELRWMELAIKRLEASTDTLIIDHTSNNGGSNFESTQFIRFFADKEAIPGFQANIRMSETFLDADTPWLMQDEETEALENEPTTFAELEQIRTDVLERLRKKFADGERWTGASSWYTTTIELLSKEFGRITGRPGLLYTKPVTLLNDRRSASNGDMVPAILQAAKRVLVSGENSAGLGGSVYRNTPVMPISEMYMRCTMGVCFRSDNLPIEGMGTVPDVRRQIGRRDLADGFETYAIDALETAVAHAAGVPAAQIQTHLPSVLRDRAELALNPLPKNYELYQRNLKLLADAIRDTQDPAEMIKIYDRYFTILGTIDTKDFQELHWQQILFPLPEALVKQDVFLAALQRKDEVLERLGEMKKVPRYVSNAKLVELIESLRAGLAKMHAPHFSNKCEAYLSPEQFFQQLEDGSTMKP